MSPAALGDSGDGTEVIRMTKRIARVLAGAAVVAAVAATAAPADAAATCYRLRTYQYVCLPVIS